MTDSSTERQALVVLAARHNWQLCRNANQAMSRTVRRGPLMVCMSFDRERRLVGAARFIQKGDMRPGVPLWSFQARTSSLAQVMRWLHATGSAPLLRNNSVHIVNAALHN